MIHTFRNRRMYLYKIFEKKTLLFTRQLEETCGELAEKCRDFDKQIQLVAELETHVDQLQQIRSLRTSKQKPSLLGSRLARVGDRRAGRGCRGAPDPDPAFSPRRQY